MAGETGSGLRTGLFLDFAAAAPAAEGAAAAFTPVLAVFIRTRQPSKTLDISPHFISLCHRVTAEMKAGRGFVNVSTAQTLTVANAHRGGL